MQIFKRTIGAIDISDIKNCDVGAPVPRKFGELGANSIRTFDSTDATVIDIDSFIAFKTKDSKGDFFKRSQGFIIQIQKLRQHSPFGCIRIVFNTALVITVSRWVIISKHVTCLRLFVFG